MLALIRAFSAPLLSLVFLIFASGLNNTVSSLRLEAEGVDKNTIGLITSALYGGVLIGSLFLARFIEKKGHIRSFVLFALTLAILAIAQGFWINSFYWSFLRLIGGICTAGIFIVIESWLLIQSPPNARGMALSIYLGTIYGALALGQFLINLSDHLSIYPFYTTALLCTLSLIPILTQKIKAPKMEEKSHLPLSQLFRISPFGFLGGIISGMLLAIIHGLVPIYGKKIGMEISEIATLMATIIFGGLSSQLFLSRWADKKNRRFVLNTSCFCTAIFGVGIALFETGPTSLLFFLSWFFGAFSFSIYPLSMAYVCEKLAGNQLIAATGGFVLSYGIGSIIGPILAPVAMVLIGNAGLFYFIALATLLLGLFGLKKPTSIDLDSKL